MKPESQALRPWALYTGLAAITCSMLLLQQFLTRVFSVQLNSGLAFLAVSTTFLGLGSAGVCVYAWPRLFPLPNVPRLVDRFALAYAVALVLGFVALVRTANSSSAVSSASPSGQIAEVVAPSLWMLPALFLVGLVLALLLRAHSDRVNRLYGADLLGGGAGCLLVLPLMDVVGGDQGIFVIGAIAAAGAALLAHAHRRPRAAAAGLLLAAAISLLPLANRNLSIVDVRSHRTTLKNVENYVLEDKEIARKWNSLSRLGFFETRDKSEVYVRIDSSCQTSIPASTGDLDAPRPGRDKFERLPFVLGHPERYLEIGAGGGIGMMLARSHGSRSITGVEINPDIVRASLSGFPGYGVAPLLADPRNRLATAEGRSWATGCGERFDVVTITFIQTGVASASAAFALSEANLFTVEAFEQFLRLLDDHGLFYVYRRGGNEFLRLISLARESLRRLGVEDARRHLYAASSREGGAILLISPTPLSEPDVAELDASCRELGVDVLYSPSVAPGARPANPFPDRIREMRRSGRLRMKEVVEAYEALIHDPRYETIEQTYVTSQDPEAFVDDYLVDIRAPDDDRPYYFFHGLHRLSDFPLYFDLAGVGVLGGTVMLLLWMGVLFTLLVGALILAPMLSPALRPKGGTSGLRRAATVITYFAGLGLGYMTVQISFIQRFGLFLGHPVYAISVVLLAFLLSSGLGSLASDRLFRPGRLTFGRTIGALVLLLLLYNQLLPAVFHSALITWPVAAKIVLSVVLVFPLAFLMGTCFPQGIRVLHTAEPDLIPWAWSANSAASVLGSILALTIAIHAGFRVDAVVAAATYGVVCLLPALAMRRWVSQPGAGVP